MSCMFKKKGSKLIFIPDDLSFSVMSIITCVRRFVSVGNFGTLMASKIVPPILCGVNLFNCCNCDTISNLQTKVVLIVVQENFNSLKLMWYPCDINIYLIKLDNLG